MPRISTWSPTRRNDFRFIDRSISEWFSVSGTAIYIHRYLGVDTPTVGTGTTGIQDVLFLENRDRKYDPDIVEMRGVYQVNDLDFDLRQFGLFLTNDTIFVEVHLNDMIAMVGRKIISGDVIELPNQRDDFPAEGPSLNKYYVVQDADRAADGWSPTWWPHVWRIKLSPMTGAQEYQDILNQQAKDPLGYNTGQTIGDIMTTIGTDTQINQAVVDAAKAAVPKRYFETQQFYVLPGTETTTGYPWVFAGDGIPPNGAMLLGSGTRFPTGAHEGDYYLRIDYDPHALFRYGSGGRWVIQERDYRGTEWNIAHRLLQSFINNEATTKFDDGTVANAKVNLSKAVALKPDYL